MTNADLFLLVRWYVNRAVPLEDDPELERGFKACTELELRLFRSSRTSASAHERSPSAVAAEIRAMTDEERAETIELLMAEFKLRAV